MEYIVTVKTGTENGLVGVRIYDRESEIIFDDFDDDGNEIYEVSVNGDIDLILDESEAVISYKRL
jgi:hypothetical protein